MLKGESTLGGDASLAAGPKSLHEGIGADGQPHLVAMWLARCVVGQIIGESAHLSLPSWLHPTPGRLRKTWPTR